MTEWHGFIPDDRTLSNRFKRLDIGGVEERKQLFVPDSGARLVCALKPMCSHVGTYAAGTSRSARE
jgi:hypothetical protein